MDIVNEVKTFLVKHLKLKKSELELDVPPSEEFGDFALPCFKFVKKTGVNPVETAKLFAEKLSKLPEDCIIKEVKAVGPYLNIFVNKQYVAKQLLPLIFTNEDFGKGTGKKERVMVEFFQANTHKAVHIGHVRNMCLGIALSNVLEFLGYRVIRANYQGDIGPHVVKCLWGIMHFNEKPPKENRLRWLGDIYARANKLISGNEKLEAEIREMTKKLYEGDPKLVELWQQTRQWCLEDFEKIYKDFGVKFDVLFFESEVEKLGKEIVLELLQKGIAKKSEGAIIMDLKKYGLGVFLLLRSDGVPLYSTKDIALAKIKFERYKIDRSIYVVGSEQELYFKQLFKTLELMGFKQAKKCYHLSYGLVMLPEGRMSSREGTIVLYDDLMEKLYKKAEEEIKARKLVPEEKIPELKKKIAFSALKFGMTMRENNKNIVFDWEKALSFEGETGPYVQYAHARICSIFRKFGGKLPAEIKFELLKTREEEKLIMLLSKFPFVVMDAGENYKIHLLCRYLLDLAQAFNEYYHAHRILDAEPELRNARLYLIECVRKVLKTGLNLLGIDAVERM
ncbi:MAG: arginine--tRNA ligase [Candidatus Hydrothermarchaeota archaeon]|nr:MAG: arginine--tRNA ligase [Candidatus Hydrothermarchaeota archaeon]